MLLVKERSITNILTPQEQLKHLSQNKSQLNETEDVKDYRIIWQNKKIKSVI